MEHILYSFRRCPYAMRARMALLAAAQHPQLREISLKNKPAPMLTASPKGTVPVLVLANGTVLEESLDIALWALRQNDPHAYLHYPSEGSALIAANDGPFKQALDRYKYPSRYASEPKQDWRGKGFAFVNQLNTLLATQPYLFSHTPTLPDIALFPFIRQFRATDTPWFDAQPVPHVHKWLQNWLDSSLFARIMPKYPLWEEGQKPLYLGEPA